MIRLVYLCLLLLPFFSCKRTETADKQKASPIDSTPHHPSYTMDCKMLLNEARRYDSTLLAQNEINDSLACIAIKAFTGYAAYCHDEAEAPIYLIKTASVAKAINNIPQAKLALETVVNNYPGFDNMPAALFMLAQLYDEVSYLNDEHEAARLYRKIISDYPNTEWVIVAKGALAMIGKSDKEMLQAFRKKSK